MPNHVHALIGFRNTGQSINTIIGNGKRFMAYEIVKRLKENGEDELLKILSNEVEETRKENQQQHAVWELSFDWKHCISEAFILQKLDYFHNNPCKGKWNLCESPVDYLHSSAKYYATGQEGIYPVMGYGEIMDVDLTKLVSSS